MIGRRLGPRETNIRLAWRIDAGALRLLDTGGETLLRFEASDQPY